MNKLKTVSLCMIVKNEETFLDKCLSSVKDIADEIIIADTGSDDGTKSIAEKYGAKIFDYKWNENFSDARNFSIQHASCDWILILDADEEFNQKDTEKFINLINTAQFDGCHFAIHNYVGSSVSYDYIMHNALRLIRNNKKYKFCGPIHEQLISVDGSKDYDFPLEDIIIYHYGYLDGVVNSKEKRARNIPLLLKQLKQEPDNSFNIFNLANEYLAQKKIDEALKLYLQVYRTADKNRTFTPHLYFRIITCLYDLNRFDEAISIADEALKLYKQCTDIEFYKGLIYYKKKLHFLAADCFNKCISMGEPPPHLKFINGCAAFRPMVCLGEIYFINEDYYKAVDFYTKALLTDNNSVNLLYKIGEALNKYCKDKSIVVSSLCNYFSDAKYMPNALVIADILINQQLYDEAYKIIDELDFDENYDIDRDYIISKIKFYKHDYDKAFDGFNSIINGQINSSILPNIKSESIKYIFILNLLRHYGDFKEICSLQNSSIIITAYEYIEQAVTENTAVKLNESCNINDIAAVIFEYLDKVICLKELDLFEKSLFVLDSIDAEYVFTPLAKLYHKYGYNKQALETVINSIKSLSSINSDTAFLLNKLI